MNHIIMQKDKSLVLCMGLDKDVRQLGMAIRRQSPNCTNFITYTTNCTNFFTLLDALYAWEDTKSTKNRLSEKQGDSE